jgi:MFS family permease
MRLTSTTSRPTVTLAVLSAAGSAYALMQSLVVPALPVLRHDLHASTTGVAWVFTSYLLAASVVTPIAGRLGDMFGKKRVFVLSLVGLAAGTPLGALAGSLALMIVLAGPILQHIDYHWLFWIPLVVIAITAVFAFVVIPESPYRAPGDIHWLGAILLSAWLTAGLLAVSEAPTWGWGSLRTLGLTVVAVILAGLWIAAEARAQHPLVDMTMMRLPGVWTTNTAALLIGFGMYSSFVLIPQYVQTPRSTGYGFGASVTQAGLFLLPATVAMLVAAPIGGRLSGLAASLAVPARASRLAHTLSLSDGEPATAD